MNKHRFGLVIGTLVGMHSALNSINGIEEEPIPLGKIIENEITRVFGEDQTHCCIETTRSFKSKLVAIQNPQLECYTRSLIKNVENSDVTAIAWGTTQSTDLKSRHIWDRRVVILSDRICSLVDHLIAPPSNNPHWVTGSSMIIRFILYHEYRYFCQTARPVYAESMVNLFEREADRYATTRLMEEMFAEIEKTCKSRRH